MYSTVQAILKKEEGQKAIIEIDKLLSEIYMNNPSFLSKHEQTIVLISELERQVNNGGFHQFFWNTSGDMTNETIDALNDIGSVHFKNIVLKVCSEFPESNVPKDRNERQKIVNEIEETAEVAWNELDNKFYKYEEDLYGLMINYIHDNINCFR